MNSVRLFGLFSSAVFFSFGRCGLFLCPPPPAPSDSRPPTWPVLRSPTVSLVGLDLLRNNGEGRRAKLLRQSPADRGLCNSAGRKAELLVVLRRPLHSRQCRRQGRRSIIVIELCMGVFLYPSRFRMDDDEANDIKRSVGNTGRVLVGSSGQFRQRRTHLPWKSCNFPSERRVSVAADSIRSSWL